MINTKFWSDTWVVEELNALDRYLFLYLITNERSNLIGIYELPLRVAAFETGIDYNDLTKMLDRLSPKVEYTEGYVYIQRATEHQADSPAINKAMQRELGALPERIREAVRKKGIISYRLAAAYDFLDNKEGALVKTGGVATPVATVPKITGTVSKKQTPSVDGPDTIPTPPPVSRVELSRVEVSKVELTKSSPAGKPPDPSVQLRKDIVDVFEFYVKSFKAEHSHIKLSDQRKAKIKARLQDAGKEMLYKAIDNTSKSQWHRGDNDRGWKANLDFIIRSYEQVEKLAEMDRPEIATDSGGVQKVTPEDLKNVRF